MSSIEETFCRCVETHFFFCGKAVPAQRGSHTSLARSWSFGMAAASANASLSSEKETFQLPAGQELRIELDHATQVAVTVRSGEAEVFGTPLVVGGRTVVYGPQKIAVYTLSGATIEVQVRGLGRCGTCDAAVPMLHACVCWLELLSVAFR